MSLCMKSWKKKQKEGYKGLTGLVREKPCKNLREKRQKIFSGALPSQREREKFEKVLKKCLNQSKHCFKKTWITMFDWSKNKFDQSNQAEAHWSFKQGFRLIKNQIRSIKILEKQLFRKITSFLKTYLKALNIRKKNAWVWDEMLFQNTSFKPNFSKFIF